MVLHARVALMVSNPQLLLFNNDLKKDSQEVYESFIILACYKGLSQNDIKKDILETEIISHSGLSDLEVKNHLNQLEWLRLVKEAQPRPSHEEFRLWNVTEKGLQEISAGQDNYQT